VQDSSNATKPPLRLAIPLASLKILIIQSLAMSKLLASLKQRTSENILRSGSSPEFSNLSPRPNVVQKGLKIFNPSLNKVQKIKNITAVY